MAFLSKHPYLVIGGALVAVWAVAGTIIAGHVAAANKG